MRHGFGWKSRYRTYPVSFQGVAERVAFACACCRSETVRPQRCLYAPWKWSIPSSACPGGGRQSSRRGAAFGFASRCKAKEGRSRPGKPHSPAPPVWAPQQYRRGYDASPVATRRSRVATPPLTATRDWLTPNPFDAARRDGFAPPRSATPQKLAGYRVFARRRLIRRGLWGRIRCQNAGQDARRQHWGIPP